MGARFSFLDAGRAVVGIRSFVIIGPLVFLGCEITPHDTESRTFVAACKDNGCQLNLVTAEGSRSFLVRGTGRVLSACAVGDVRGFDCRPLVCEDGRVCSTLGGADYACVRGLCQAVERRLSSDDLTALCLAGTGAFVNNAAQVERITLARAASGSRVVPAACRQP